MQKLKLVLLKKQNTNKHPNHQTELHHECRIFSWLSKWFTLHPAFCINTHCGYLSPQKCCHPRHKCSIALLCLSVPLAQRHHGLNFLSSDGNHILNFSSFLGKNNLNLETKMKTFSVAQGGFCAAPL